MQGLQPAWQQSSMSGLGGGSGRGAPGAGILFALCMNRNKIEFINIRLTEGLR
jgi:hypothetical protein